MKLMSSFSLSLTLLLLSFSAQAQMGLEGFKTGRYEIKKGAEKVRKPSMTAESASDVTTLKVPAVTIQTENKKSSLVGNEDIAAEKNGVAPEVAPATTEPVSVSKVQAGERDANSTEISTKAEEPSISEQAESLFSAKAEKVFEFYKLQIHPDDIRNNKVEIDIAPTMMYVDSKSNYVYRNYQSFFNALKLKTAIWFTPRLGVSGNYLMSFAADVDGVNSTSRIPAKYEYVDIAVNVRKYFGVSRLSNSMEFALLYTDSKVKFDSQNTSRSRLHSTGLGLGLKTRIPTSDSYAWTVGGGFFPRLQHTEGQTAVDVTSGSSDENSRITIDVGGELKFERQSQIVWNLGILSERNVFGGTAAALDSSTGVTPQNVSVTNSSFVFSLGYRWGH